MTKTNNTIKIILSGILLNGYIQGRTGKKLNTSVLENGNRGITKALKDE